MIPKSNNLSHKAHWLIACFLAALHITMLESLKRLKSEGNIDGRRLLEAWHEQMEGKRESEYRKKFFLEVIKKAEEVSHHYFSISYYQTSLLLCSYVPRRLPILQVPSL
jgi:hypothetical protein